MNCYVKGVTPKGLTIWCGPYTEDTAKGVARGFEAQGQSAELVPAAPEAREEANAWFAWRKDQLRRMQMRFGPYC